MKKVGVTAEVVLVAAGLVKIAVEVAIKVIQDHLLDLSRVLNPEPDRDLMIVKDMTKGNNLTVMIDQNQEVDPNQVTERGIAKTGHGHGQDPGLGLEAENT